MGRARELIKPGKFLQLTSMKPGSYPALGSLQELVRMGYNGPLKEKLYTRSILIWQGCRRAYCNYIAMPLHSQSLGRCPLH